MSLREIISMFDKSAMWIKMLSTNLLALNMPELTKDYGSNSQFDIVSTMNQEKSLIEDDYSGFTIDGDGHISGTFNLISYIKIAPQDMKVKQHKYESVSEDDEEEEEDDDDTSR